MSNACNSSAAPERIDVAANDLYNTLMEECLALRYGDDPALIYRRSIEAITETLKSVQSTPTASDEAVAREILNTPHLNGGYNTELKRIMAILARHRPAADAVLRKAAQDVVDRWDSPKWRDLPHTGVFIDALRKALAAQPAEVSGCEHRSIEMPVNQPYRYGFCRKPCANCYHPECSECYPRAQPEVVTNAEDVAHAATNCAWQYVRTCRHIPWDAEGKETEVLAILMHSHAQNYAATAEADLAKAREVIAELINALEHISRDKLYISASSGCGYKYDAGWNSSTVEHAKSLNTLQSARAFLAGTATSGEGE